MALVIILGRWEYYLGFNKYWPFMMCAGRMPCAVSGVAWTIGLKLEKY